MLQRDLHAQLKSSLEFSRDRIAALARPLHDDQLSLQPPAGGWSIAEVLEHLCMVDEQYEERTWGLVAAARPTERHDAKRWAPTWLGGLMAGELEGERPIKAAVRYRPGARLRPGVVEQFLARSATLVVQMDIAAPLDWTSLRLSVPRMPFFFRLNLGDVYTIHTVHVARHLGQIERILAAIG